VKMEWKRNGIPVSASLASYDNNTVVTVAGGNGIGSALNQLGTPNGLFIDHEGNKYIAELTNHRVTKWAPGATQGVVVAGGNGQGAQLSQLAWPTEVFVDKYGYMYIAESDNYRVTKWAPGSSSGVIVAGGNGYGSALNQIASPSGLWVDDTGNLYVCEVGNSRVTKWAPGATSGVVVAGGNGSGNAANQLYGPTEIRMDAAGNLYVCENSGQRVTKWTPGATSGITIAGNGSLGYGPVNLNNPMGIDFDLAGNLYVLNAYYNTIWRWSPGATQGVYMAGYCCSGLGSLKNVASISIGKDGALYVVDQTNYRVQKYPVNTASTSYTPSSAGDYTLETTTFANCIATSNTVSVHAIPIVNFTGNQYFCEGASTTLDAGTHQQYSWSTGSTSQMETFSTEGNYSVTVSDFGCSNTTSFYAYEATPDVSLSASSYTICNGQTAQVSANLTSGGGLITKSIYLPASAIPTLTTSCAYGTVYENNYYHDINWTDAGLGTPQSVKVEFTVGYEGITYTNYTYSLYLNNVYFGGMSKTPYNVTCSPAAPANRVSVQLNPSYYVVGGNNVLRIYKGTYGDWGLVPDSAWNNLYAKVTVVYKVAETTYQWEPGNLTGATQSLSPVSTTTYTMTASSGSCTSTQDFTISLTTVAGDPVAYGDHVWNVYAWNAGGANFNSGAWNTNYAGYYVDNNLNYNSKTMWSDLRFTIGCSKLAGLCLSD
jgi:sugar lactone lactonase YvrE